MIWWSYKDNHPDIPDELMSTYLGRFYFPPSWPIPVYLEYIIWLNEILKQKNLGTVKRKDWNFSQLYDNPPNPTIVDHSSVLSFPK